jgi:hypothetical protein
MAGPSLSYHISSPEIVNLFEIDEPVGDFLVKVWKVKLLTWAVKSYSESDNGIGEENSDEASNPAQSSSKNRGTSVAGTLCINRKNVPPTVKNAKLKKKARSFLNSQTV